MLEALKMQDCVSGTRAATRGKGDNWIRIASSRIANWVRNKLSGETSAMPAARIACSNANALRT
jgi:hypothetical protein